MTPVRKTYVRAAVRTIVIAPAWLLGIWLLLNWLAGLSGPVFAGEIYSGAPYRVIVAIDAGHGGIDPGAIADDLLEKQVVMNFAILLAARIDLSPNLRAFLIRSDDSFLTLTQRIRRARSAGANLLLSLHADTTHEGRAEGAHVYTLSHEGTNPAAIQLAVRENRTDLVGDANLAGEPDDLAALLVDLAQRGTMDETQKLAAAILDAMAERVTLLPTQPHRRANFRVLRAPEIPSILVELGYLSNVDDRLRMTSGVWQASMAEALTEGIQQWITVASPGFLKSKK